MWLAGHFFYVHERSLTEARARLTNNEEVSEDIALRLCAASYQDDIGDDEIMIPVNMEQVEQEVGHLCEHWAEMVDELGAKETCEYIIMARDHFDDLQLKFPVHKQPQPITQRVWKAKIHGYGALPVDHAWIRRAIADRMAAARNCFADSNSQSADALRMA